MQFEPLDVIGRLKKESKKFRSAGEYSVCGLSTSREAPFRVEIQALPTVAYRG